MEKWGTKVFAMKIKLDNWWNVLRVLQMHYMQPVRIDFNNMNGIKPPN